MNKNIVSKITTGLIILFILFFGLKGCVVTIWSSPKSPEIYSVLGADGFSMSMILLPNHETIIGYTNPSEDHFEVVLTEMKGSYGAHYFWRLWHIEGPGIYFGYRIYPPDAEPVHMEITILERYMEGRGNPTFPDKGTRTYDVMLFGKDAVRFQDMWLERDVDDPEYIDMMLKLLGGSQRKS